MVLSCGPCSEVSVWYHCSVFCSLSLSLCSLLMMVSSCDPYSKVAVWYHCSVFCSLFAGWWWWFEAVNPVQKWLCITHSLSCAFFLPAVVMMFWLWFQFASSCVMQKLYLLSLQAVMLVSSFDPSSRAANLYALSVIYYSWVDCITLLCSWWNSYAKKCKLTI